MHEAATWSCQKSIERHWKGGQRISRFCAQLITDLTKMQEFVTLTDLIEKWWMSGYITSLIKRTMEADARIDNMRGVPQPKIRRTKTDRRSQESPLVQFNGLVTRESERTHINNPTSTEFRSCSSNEMSSWNFHALGKKMAKKRNVVGICRDYSNEKKPYDSCIFTTSLWERHKPSWVTFDARNWWQFARKRRRNGERFRPLSSLHEWSEIHGRTRTQTSVPTDLIVGVRSTSSAGGGDYDRYRLAQLIV